MQLVALSFRNSDFVRKANHLSYDYIKLLFYPNYNLCESRVVVLLREKRGECRIFVGKHKGKRQLGRSVRAWKGIIKVDLKEGAELVLCM